MRREIRYAAGALRRKHLVPLALWSVPEALPSMFSGFAVARAVDRGFLAHRPMVGVAWLAALLLVSFAGAAGSAAVLRRLGFLVEPVRDDLVHRVVRGALRRGSAGRSDDGAVARLTHQVEIVRDTYAGQIMVLRTFTVTVIGAVIGLLSLAPIIVVLILPVFLVGVLAFLATLGLAASRQQEYLRCNEKLSETTGSVFAGLRDVVACGGEAEVAAMVGRSIRAQARAELAQGRVAALRSLCFALGGWGPLLVVLFAVPWLISRGLSAGAILGGLTYVLSGLQSALNTLVNGVGGSGLRLIITLRRILGLDSAEMPKTAAVIGDRVRLRGVTFRYGPHAEPVLRDLDLALAEGDHLAVVGPSGVGKSTLAGMMCGLLAPSSGIVEVLAPGDRVLIPQEAYVFTATIRENLTYLNPLATDAEIDCAVTAVGADALVERLGGPAAQVRPGELSAGERQLISLARAYLSPAPLIVLDEATCHLDPAAERVAEEAFAGRGGTLVVIAHRISSALRARRILVLDGVNHVLGTHESLLSTSELYRDLLGHWSDPAGRGGDVDGFQARASAGLADDPREVVVHRPGA